MLKGAAKEFSPGGEPLAGQRLGAVGASEALPVPGIVAISDSALGDHLPHK